MAILEKCQKLAELIKANLTDIQYFDVGGNESEIHFYLIGKSPLGNKHIGIVNNRILYVTKSCMKIGLFLQPRVNRLSIFTT
ncbi:hypothetical protein SD80_003740 [Scytonema tolypothrichoides VB-61278]|nr:hypothetical protein SD80_003740 [Scytonema tolypothrichoides VB-61278]